MTIDLGGKDLDTIIAGMEKASGWGLARGSKNGAEGTQPVKHRADGGSGVRVRWGWGGDGQMRNRRYRKREIKSDERDREREEWGLSLIHI